MPSVLFAFVRFFRDHEDSLRTCNFAVSCSTFVQHDECFLLFGFHFSTAGVVCQRSSRTDEQ